MANDAAELPSNWASTTLDETCEILDSQRIPVNNSERLKRTVGVRAEELYPYYGATGQVGVIDDYLFSGEHVLLGEDGAPFLDPFKDKAYLVGGKFWVNNHAHILKAHVSNKYLTYFLNQLGYSDHVTGTTRLKLTQAALKKIPVLLAPENEQDRIVVRIETLFSELDKGIEALKTAREQLKVYRQAVLKHAFEGKLTARWREENKDKLESPEQLLARLQQERQARYEQQLKAWREALNAWEESSRQGKKPAKPGKLKPVSTLSGSLLELLPSLPANWSWQKLGWMTCGVEYGTAAKSAESGLVPVIRMGNLQNSRIDWSDLVFTSQEEEIEKYSLKAGDVLFNRTNSPELVGKTAIYQGERPALFAGYLIRVNQFESIADGRYVNLFLNSLVAKQYGDSVKTDGVNQSNINGEKLQSYPFPYCSIDEQREVVRQVDGKLSNTDRLMDDLNAELKRASSVRQSILKKAFSGQLVPQDPNDEPASKLLERIRAERAKRSATKPVTRKKTRRKRSASAD